MSPSTTVLEGVNLTKSFWVRQGRGPLPRRAPVRAVDNVSIRLDAGKVTALVGESGAGKTTVGRLLAQIVRPDGGKVLLAGKPAPVGRPRSYAAQVQMVFQDPFASLNPVHRVRHHLERPLKIHHFVTGDASAAVDELLRRVALNPPRQFASKFPHELSGGQRQRVVLARALVLEPQLLVCDEPVSALDVSIQAQIINLLMDLQDELKLSYLFVAHDLAVVEHISDRVAVMYLGRIVETTDKTSLFETPLHPYTEALLSAVPIPKASARTRKRVILTGDVPSPINPPTGCHFHTRCPYVMARCRHEAPALREVRPKHWAACHLHDDGLTLPLAKPVTG